MIHSMIGDLIFNENSVVSKLNEVTKKGEGFKEPI